MQFESPRFQVTVQDASAAPTEPLIPSIIGWNRRVPSKYTGTPADGPFNILQPRLAIQTCWKVILEDSWTPQPPPKTIPGTHQDTSLVDGLQGAQQSQPHPSHDGPGDPTQGLGGGVVDVKLTAEQDVQTGLDFRHGHVELTLLLGPRPPRKMRKKRTLPIVQKNQSYTNGNLYTYIYIYICIYVYVYIYIYIWCVCESTCIHIFPQIPAVDEAQFGHQQFDITTPSLSSWPWKPPEIQQIRKPRDVVHPSVELQFFGFHGVLHSCHPTLASWRPTASANHGTWWESESAGKYETNSPGFPQQNFQTKNDLPFSAKPWPCFPWPMWLEINQGPISRQSSVSFGISSPWNFQPKQTAQLCGHATKIQARRLERAESRNQACALNHFPTMMPFNRGKYHIYIYIHISYIIDAYRCNIGYIVCIYMCVYTYIYTAYI